MRRVSALVVLAALLVPVAPAAGQGNPFAPLPQPQQPAPQPVQPVNADDDNGLSGTQTALILAAAGFLLGGIAWAVLRDARTRAPVEDDRRAGLPGEGGGVQRSHEEHRKAKARARARAKQARKARRKNR